MNIKKVRNKRPLFAVLRFLLCIVCCAFQTYAQGATQSSSIKAARFFDGQKFREIRILQEHDSNLSAQSQNSNAPNSNVILQFFYGSRYYNVHFSSEIFAALEVARDNYFSDFQNKKLKSNDKKSVSKYGSFSTQIEWGTSRENIEQFANADVTLGYNFVNKSPYFAIFVKNAQTQNAQTISPAIMNSGNILLLFTKAQIKELTEVVL